MANIHGRRLCPADVAKADEQGAHRVNMGKRVQRKPALPLCGVVAQRPSHKPVGALVYGEYHKNNHKCGKKSNNNSLHRGIGLSRYQIKQLENRTSQSVQYSCH